MNDWLTNSVTSEWLDWLASWIDSKTEWIRQLKNRQKDFDNEGETKKVKDCAEWSCAQMKTGWINNEMKETLITKIEDLYWQNF